MKILYCHDNFYSWNPNGTICSAGQFPYEYWSPFLQAFDSVKVVGRIMPVKPSTNFERMNISSGPNVDFELLPNINSPGGLARHYTYVKHRLKTLIAESDAVVVRAASDIGWLAFRLARSMNKPIALEMVACAWDSTWNHGSTYARIYAPVRFVRARIMAAHADYVLYVSQNFLQRRYPASGRTAVASNVRLEKADKEMLARKAERIEYLKKTGKPLTVGLIGSLDNKLKGVETALKAMAVLEASYPGQFIFRHLGQGKQGPYKDMAYRYSVASAVHFDGMMPSGQAVIDWLDTIDIYIQPSFQEGIPRATLEAMSRGCPVIASRAGGLPEIIDRQALHRPGDYMALARAVAAIGRDFNAQMNHSVRNFDKARDFEGHILMPRRVAFWKDFAVFARQAASARAQPMPSYTHVKA